MATPGVERTNAKHGITSLILNSHAGKNLTLKFQGTLVYVKSMVVEEKRDRPLFFCRNREKFRKQKTFKMFPFSERKVLAVLTKEKKFFKQENSQSLCSAF